MIISQVEPIVANFAYRKREEVWAVSSENCVSLFCMYSSIVLMKELYLVEKLSSFRYLRCLIFFDKFLVFMKITDMPL